MSTPEDIAYDRAKADAEEDMRARYEAALVAREEWLTYRLRHDEPTDWYLAPDSACSAEGCPHGPRWHNDPSGCTRMIEGWCPCERVYLPSSTGPDDFIAE